MIPSYEETIRMIEEQFPHMEWLLRNNKGPQGKYFCHLHSADFNPQTNSFQISYKVWGNTKEQVVWEVYSMALLGKADVLRLS